MNIPEQAYVPIGVVIGAVIALVGVFVTQLIGRRTSREIEEKKIGAARLDLITKEVNTRVATLAANLGAAGHSMAWLVWAANNRVGVRATGRATIHFRLNGRVKPRLLTSTL
jgi:hypothetical protein